MLGVIRQVVVEWLMADKASAPRCLSGNKHCCYRVGDDPMLAGDVIIANRGSAPLRCALREPADRTWAPVHDHPPTPFERVFTCLYRAGRRGIVREPEAIGTPLPGISSERAWSNTESQTFATQRTRVRVPSPQTFTSTR